jgi:hypothetical protein
MKQTKKVNIRKVICFLSGAALLSAGGFLAQQENTQLSVLRERSHLKVGCFVVKTRDFSCPAVRFTQFASPPTNLNERRAECIPATTQEAYLFYVAGQGTWGPFSYSTQLCPAGDVFKWNGVLGKWVPCDDAATVVSCDGYFYSITPKPSALPCIGT